MHCRSYGTPKRGNASPNWGSLIGQAFVRNTEVRCHFVRVALFANAINSDCRPVFVFAKIVRKCERAVS